jgi:hypothetical protein
MNRVSDEMNRVSDEMNRVSDEMNRVSDEMNSVTDKMNSDNEMNSVNDEMNSDNQMNTEQGTGYRVQDEKFLFQLFCLSVVFVILFFTDLFSSICSPVAFQQNKC